MIKKDCSFFKKNKPHEERGNTQNYQKQLNKPMRIKFHSLVTFGDIVIDEAHRVSYVQTK